MQRLGTSFLGRTLLALALVILVTAVGPAALEAQSTTTGSISGLVTAQSEGTGLPGAQITAVHEPTGTRYTSVTSPDGHYRIVGVRAGGPYTVSAAMDGFRAQQQGGLEVRLGEDLNVSFSLVLETIEETVTVISTDPLINPSRMGTGSNVPEAAIENLPSVGRGLEDYARTNPFFSVAAENEDPDAISVAGRSSRYNNIQIDGAVNNDLFGLADQGTPGGQANTQPISLDAVQEIQLVVSPYDVRQGGFTGGGVNVITRSGTNSYKGSAYYYTRDDSLVGDVEQLGDFGTFEEDQYGFRLGGPIKRDKIFFFVNAETTDETTPTGWSLDGSGGQAFADGKAVEEAEVFRQALIDRYGFDPGGLGQNTRDTPNDKIFARLDFNIGDSNAFTFRHNYIDAENDINRPDNRTYEWPSETYFFQNETNSTVAQLNSVFGTDKFNEARVSYQTIKDRRSGRGGVKFPWIEIERVSDFQTGENLGEFEVGTEPFSTKNALDQDILEITNDFTWLMGNHTLTLGTHNEFFTFDNLFIQNAFGAYQFRTLEDFLNGNDARQFDYTVVPPGQADSQKFDVYQIGLYAGDQWRVRPDLTVTYGLRVDVPYFPDDPTRNPRTEDLYGYRTDEMPSGEQLWSPRVGFNWDITGKGTSQLRGGTGIFAGRTPYVWISNNYARTGIEQEFIRAFGVPFNPDPNDQPSDFGTSGGEFNLIDPNFKFPEVWRTNLAYDQQLPWLGLVGSIEVIYADSLEEIDYKDLNLVQTDTVPFDGRPYFSNVDRNVSGAYLITNTTKGDATNLAVKLEKPFSGSWWGFVSYAYGEANVVNDGTSSRAVSNFQFTEAVDPNNVGLSPSDYEVEHRFNAAISYTADWGGTKWPTTVSAFYNHQSGRPYSNIYSFQVPSGGINHDFYFSNDLLYVPSGPDDVVITNGTWEDLDGYIRADGCLDKHRGGIAPRNCSDAPWYHSLDVRIAQEIPIRNTHIQVSLDLENLMNLIDEDSGLVRYANFNAVAPVDYIGVTDDGKPIYELNNIVFNPEDRWNTHNVRSRWRAKLGLRWTF